jgi:ribosomal protein L37AE/L43A
MGKIPQLKNVRADIKEAQDRVKAVHNCPECSAHLKAIADHQLRRHKDQ